MKRIAAILVLLACCLPVCASGKKTKPVKTADGTAPQGATAKCQDGTYSFSASHKGTCSHHGGVDAWIQQKAPGTSESAAKEATATGTRATTETPGTPTGETTATGKPIYEGPKGGKYHISKNGNKAYEKKSKSTSSSHSHHSH
jgi:hypothetical protein